MDDIRSQSDIGQVIGAYLNLQRAGSNFKTLCPFHKEKTPSFHVNAQRQIYHCFGCGAGGDVFRFVQQYENVDFLTAVRMLAQRVGIRLELEDGGEDSGGVDKNQLYKIHAEVAALYHQALLARSSAAVARRYLEKRDLGEEAIKTFHLGYAPDRWDAVLEWARRNRYPLEQVELGGLILKRTDAGGESGGYYDRFRHRLMFPIADEQGRVIGFSGRALEDAPQTAKYVNSPETPLFKKSRVLYALDQARRAIVDAREAIVCEGQIDVIRCHQAGFTTAVAAQGTAFTDEHVRILKRYADSVCLFFDSDKAGQDAAVRAAGVFMQAGLAVRVGRLPAKEDPDSFLRRHGPDAFRKLIEKAGSAVGFQIEVMSAREDAQTQVGLMRIAKAVLAMIAQSPNAVQRAALVQEAAGALRLPAAALQDDLRRLSRSAQRAEPAAPDAPPLPPHPADEVALGEHAIHAVDTPELAALLRQYLPFDLITDTVCRTLVEACVVAAETGRDFQDVLRDHDDPTGELQRLAVQLQEAPSKVTGREYSRLDAVRDLILRLWRQRFEKERSELAAGPDAAGAEAQARTRQLTSHLHHLRRWKDGAEIIEHELTE
jgi:DNA primase